MLAAVRWSVNNSPSMNTFLAAILFVGAGSLLFLQREVFPEFQLEIIVATVPYPGASPSEVEEAVCQRIEEAIRTVDGIKKVYSVASEGTGSVIAELQTSAETQRALEEIRSAIDRIPSFPELAEDPQVRELVLRTPAINVAVAGGARDDPATEWKLRELAEQVRNELLLLPSISQIDLIAAKEYQIDVEIREADLRKYGMTLQQAAETIRKENLELPAGDIKTANAEYLVRGKNRRLEGVEIARLPLRTDPTGLVLAVGDIANVRDGFEDTTALTEIDGRPAQGMVVQKAPNEDLLFICRQVHEYVRGKTMPPGFELRVWGDRSVMVRDRLELLTRNGVYGLLLVFLVLSLFLDMRLAFWVALGIPVSILGACIVMYYTGATLNMLSMFAFVMGLGIVVDDAIVVGENVHSHRQQGKPLIEAAIDGTLEVAPSVIASVTTTIIAFSPLLFVSGVMGKFLAVMPLAVIAMLVVSLIESLFILPCHLAHERSAGLQHFWKRVSLSRPSDRRGQAARIGMLWAVAAVLTGPAAYAFIASERSANTTTQTAVIVGVVSVVGSAFVLSLLICLQSLWRLVAFVLGAARQRLDSGLQRLIDRIYTPALNWHLDNAGLTYGAAVCLLLVSGGLVAGGYTPFVVFPKIDSDFVRAQIAYPVGVPGHRTDKATRRLEAAAREVAAEFEAQGTPVLRLIQRSVGQISREGELRNLVGSNVGEVFVELLSAETRGVRSDDFIQRWRERAGEFPGVQELTFSSAEIAPSGAPIEFKLLGDDVKELERAAEAAKKRLAGYPGVFDITDDSDPGKWELQIRVHPDAQAMGIQLEEVAGAVRAAYYGDEVMRLQRGRHEVKLMVRYPPDERTSLAGFDEIRIRTPDGNEVPLPELAEVTLDRGYSEINRIDQVRALTVTADVDEQTANARNIVNDLKADFLPDLYETHPGVSIRWEGQEERTNESVASLFIGFVVAILAMFALLTAEFRSYLQPLMILAIIPFGTIGAVGGHLLLGLPLTMFSLFGIVALSGVLANDSIVLIDFANRRLRDGVDLRTALVDSGCRRFRPVLLTSITTVAGLLPILVETSIQAQVLIPMAVSLSFGLMLATLLVLILIPTMYQTWKYWCVPDEADNDVVAIDPTIAT